MELATIVSHSMDAKIMISYATNLACRVHNDKREFAKCLNKQVFLLADLDRSRKHLLAYGPIRMDAK